MAEMISAATAVCENEDRKIFDDLVNRYHRQIYNVAYRMTGNATDAEDLTQETFVKAFRFFHRYNREMPFDNWLYRIMTNLNIDMIRRRPKVHIRSIDEPIQHDEGEAQMEIRDDSEGPEDQALSSELDAEMQKALSTLSPDFRMAVVLSDIEGLSYEEVSEAMGCSIGTVRSRLHRGRRLLRERLKPYLERL